MTCPTEVPLSAVVTLSHSGTAHSAKEPRTVMKPASRGQNHEDSIATSDVIAHDMSKKV